MFSYKEQSEAFESLWTNDRHDMLTAFLAKIPVRWCFFVKHAMFDAVKAGRHSELALDLQMQALFDDLMSKLPELKASMSDDSLAAAQ